MLPQGFDNSADNPLKAAGWTDEELMEADSTVYFPCADSVKIHVMSLHIVMGELHPVLPKDLFERVYTEFFTLFPDKTPDALAVIWTVVCQQLIDFGNTLFRERVQEKSRTLPGQNNVNPQLN